MKNIKTLVLGEMQVNCYLIEENGHVIIVDPGSTPRRILEAVDGKQTEAILLTHGHFDHIGAVDELVKKLNCPVYISEEDAPMLQDVRLNGSYMMREFTVHTKPKHYTSHMKIGSFEFDVLPMPGHTLGSVCLCMEDVMFSGDVLFKEGIGRTDLAWASLSQMVNTCKALSAMTKDWIVYPGHGPSTTLFYEFEHNPYLK